MTNASPVETFEDWRNGGFALYVHWPFCAAKCPYCDFNSHVTQGVNQQQWADAYVSQIRHFGEMLPGRTLDSIFFGGGTPSLMDPDVVHQIIAAARMAWSTRNTLEVTLEANPTSVEAGRFRGYQDAGVNRVSLGIQALNDPALRALGRLHTAQEALQAWDIATHVFDRASFDLIYARQFQSYEDWEQELRQALTLEPTHLSPYQLTIEEGTAFGDRHRRGKLRGLPDEDLSADLYELTQHLCEGVGLLQYEISNHAKPGYESRHNRVYWRYGDYVGIGPGAHGRLTLQGRRYAQDSLKAPLDWMLIQIRDGKMPYAIEALTAEEQANEYLLMSLRLTEGCDLSRWKNLGGAGISESRVDALEDLGLIWRIGNKIGATWRGRPVLNAIIAELVGR